MGVYHIFLSQLSVDGHMGCCHVLDIVNNAFTNFGVHYLFKSKFLSFTDTCPEVKLLDQMIALFLVFLETSILFSIVAAPIYIPINSVGELPFLHTLSSIYYYYFGHTMWCEGS